MRTYTVAANDSPASIAARFAGCPRCGSDLIGANPSKPAVTLPNGFRTFQSLRIGETINLPEAWFNGQHDALPAAYFARLPNADGVSFGVGDAAIAQGRWQPPTYPEHHRHGAIRHVPIIEQVTWPTPGPFGCPDGTVYEPISKLCIPAPVQVEIAKAETIPPTQLPTTFRRVKGWEMPTPFNCPAGTVYEPISKLCIPTYRPVENPMFLHRQRRSAGVGADPLVTPTDDALTTAALDLASTLNGDPNYCASVAVDGTAVNSAVHNFKLAWNAAGGTPVPVGTGNYEPSVSAALASVLGPTVPTFPGCPARGGTGPMPPQPPIGPLPPAPKKDPGLSTAGMAGLALLAAGTVGGVVYLASSKKKKRRGR